MTMKWKFTAPEALRALLDTGTHSFLVPAYAHAICEALGVAPAYVQREKANTGRPKGLTTDSGKRGEVVEGVAAFALTPHICRQLSLPYPEMLGRGSQYRVALEVLLDHLRTQGITPTETAPDGVEGTGSGEARDLPASRR